MQKYTYAVLFAVIVLAANVGISRYMINKAVGTMQTEFAQHTTKPKIIVIDEAILHDQLKFQPNGQQTTPAQLLADRENLFTALRLQNYVVMSNTNLLTYPLSSELNNVNMNEVRAFLRSNNMTISTETDHEQTVRFAQKLIDEQLRQIAK